jgi:hypothetical protein
MFVPWLSRESKVLAEVLTADSSSIILARKIGQYLKKKKKHFSVRLTKVNRLKTAKISSFFEFIFSFIYFFFWISSSTLSDDDTQIFFAIFFIETENIILPFFLHTQHTGTHHTRHKFREKE